MCGPNLVDDDFRQRIAAFNSVKGMVSAIPFGPDDEIGMLNLLTPGLAREQLARADGGKVFDLSVDLFMGMPT